MVLKRLSAFFIDYMIICMVIIPPAVLLSIPNSIVMVVGVSMVWCKDLLGMSVGKRLLAIEVVCLQSNQRPSLWMRFLRNVSLVLWPIEVLVLIGTKEKRIGDMIANTRVVEIN